MSEDGDKRFIRRMERANSTAGWEVRVRRKGLNVSRLFSDSVCGGRLEALQSARDWRNQQPWMHPWLKRVPPPAELSLRNPRLPILGQYLSQLLIGEELRACVFWYVTWKDAKGREITRKFSANYLGEAVAEDKARRLHAAQYAAARQALADRWDLPEAPPTGPAWYANEAACQLPPTT